MLAITSSIHYPHCITGPGNFVVSTGKYFVKSICSNAVSLITTTGLKSCKYEKK